MTFESMIDTPNVNATTENVANPPLPVPAETPAVPAASPLEQALAVESEEQLVVKAVFGNDIRRANSVAKYAPLLEVCSNIFELNPATTVLKYQDEDGDKITMSSDNELNEARKLAQDKVLRVFVETKAAPAAPQAQDAPYAHAAPFPGGMAYPWAHHGPFAPGHYGPRGFGGRGGFRGHHGFHHTPHHPIPPHQGGFPHPHPHPHGAPGHHAFPFHPQPFSPVQTATFQQPQQSGTTTATYSTAHVTSHGVFSPADSTPPHCSNARAEASPYARCAWKERRQAVKEHIKFMKANCATEEDRQALKQFKQQAYEEFKAEKRAMKQEKKCGKKDKKDKKWEKKSEKKDKCDSEKWEKKCERRNMKNNSLMARHVADVTIPDNTELPADTPVTKTWRLRNAGNIAWPEDSQLLFVSRRGDDLNGPERVFVGAVEPQQEVDVSVTFVTPAEPGRYIGYYRMATANGKFGQRVWVSFIVPAPAAPSTPAIEQPSAPMATDADAPAQDDAKSTTALLDVTME